MIDPFPSTSQDIFFSLRKSFVCTGIVIREEGDGWMEKFSPFACLFHMRYELWKYRFVLLFRILLVEYTVLLICQPYTSEAIVAVTAIIGIIALVEIRSAIKC
jgi:hypothetical protein